MFEQDGEYPVHSVYPCLSILLFYSEPSFTFFLRSLRSHDFSPSGLLGGFGSDSAAKFEIVILLLEFFITFKPLGIDSASLYRGSHRAVWFRAMRAITELAMGGERLDVVECLSQSVARFPELQLAHAGSVENESASRKHYKFAVRCGMFASIIAQSNLSNLLNVAAHEPVYQSRFPYARRAEHRDCFTRLEILIERIEAFILQNADYVNSHAESDSFDFAKFFFDLIAKVGFAENDDRACSTLPGSGQIAFDSSQVEIVIERCNDEYSVDIRADYLFFASKTSDLASETASTRQDVMNGCATLFESRADCDPVADCWYILAAQRLMAQSAAHFRCKLAVFGIDAIALTVFDGDPRRTHFRFSVAMKTGFKEAVPSESFELSASLNARAVVFIAVQFLASMTVRARILSLRDQGRNSRPSQSELSDDGLPPVAL